MITFILLLNNEIVDSAGTPSELDFMKVDGQIEYEVAARIEDWPDSGGPIYPVAAVNLTGYTSQSNWVVEQLCEEIDFRRALSDFEFEIKNASGPIIAFGEMDFNSNGFIV